MSSNENYSKSGDGKELLNDLTDQLGIEGSGATDTYKKQARSKYFWPRLAFFLILLAVIVVVVICLLLPVRFHDVETQESPSAMTVDFGVDRLLLLDSVTATLDDHGITVDELDAGKYQVSVDRNGELVITARTFMGKETSQSFTVACVDDEPPHIASHEKRINFLYIYITDGENGSGINWDTLNATYADSGEHYDIATVNEEEGYIRLLFPKQSIRIYVEDMNGNPLSMLLELGQKEAEQTNTEDQITAP